MLGDCHIHMVLDGVYYRDAISAHRGHVRDDLIRERLAAYRDAGVTYLRDGGDAFGVCERARELAPEYGIEYRVPCFPMCLRGRYGMFISIFVPPAKKNRITARGSVFPAASLVVKMEVRVFRHGSTMNPRKR